MPDTMTVNDVEIRVIKLLGKGKVVAIDYHSGRKLNKSLIERMANCEYITEYRNIFICECQPLF